MFEEYTAYLPNDKDINVLDIGCGGGDLILFLKKKEFNDIYGIDVDEGAIRTCKEKGIKEAERIEELGSYLEGKKEKYGLIFAREVIYYFPEDKLKGYLNAINRSLAKGGVFIVEVFNGAVLTANFVKYKDHGIKSIFTEHSIRNALEGSGFEVTAIFGNITPIKGLKRFLWIILQKAWFAVLRSIYILERGFDPNNPKILSKSIIAIAKKHEKSNS